MTQLLPIFTPSLAPAELLEQLFVARDELLDDVVARIRDAATTRSRNHTLLVGPRGAGKTHLIALAHHRAAALDGVKLQLCWLPEDPWAITSYRRLLDAIFDRLEVPLTEADRKTVAASVEAAEAWLLRRVKKAGPVVLFVENLDQVLAAIKKLGQQRLRHLAQERALLFVASTTSLSRAFTDQHAPFYMFFTTARLVPLTIDQAGEMLRGIAELQDKTDVVEYLQTPEAIARLRTIAHLAGGQPRIWALMSQALSVEGLSELVEMMLTQFDKLTPYYQEQLARLSPHQREIVVTLIDADRPMTVKELAERTGIDQRSVSKTIFELRDRSWVVETNSPLTKMLDRRRTYYELGEPLARVAFQLKASRGTPIELIVEFLKAWFEPRQLVDAESSTPLVSEYVRTARLALETDTALAVAHVLVDIPYSFTPGMLHLLAAVDAACIALAGGDPEPALALPSVLRGAVEAGLRGDADLVAAVERVRTRIHSFAQVSLRDGPIDEAREWLARARFFRHPTFEVFIWLVTLGEIEEGYDVYEEMLGTAGWARKLWGLPITTGLLVVVTTPGGVRFSEYVVSRRAAAFGPNDAATISARADLAVMYAFNGLTDEAVATAQEAVAACARASCVDETTRVGALTNLAYAHERAGRVELAERITRRAMSAARRALKRHDLSEHDRRWLDAHLGTLAGDTRGKRPRGREAAVEIGPRASGR